MRKQVALAAVSALTLAVGAVGVAEAVQSTQSMDIKLQKSKAGTKAKPASVGKLTVDLGVAINPADPPFATRTVTINFDKNLVFSTAKFPSCTEAQARSGAAKCTAAKVGSGTATGDASAIDPNTGQKVAFPRENLTVTAYNGTPGSTLYLRVRGSVPLNIDNVIIGKLQNASGAYGKKLLVTVPQNLQTPTTGVTATLSNFDVTVGGTSKGVPYIGLKGCSAGKLKFKGDFVFTDGTKQTVNDTAPCKK